LPSGGNGPSIASMIQAFNELPDAVRYGFAFGIPFLVTLLATPFVARTAIRRGLVDRPAPHKSHLNPTPYLGGAALAAGLGVTGIVAAGGSLQIATILVCAVAIGVMGLVDDARGLQPPIKLAVEAGAAVALYVTGSGGGVFGSPIPDLLLTVVWVVVITNALNLLDNMDGLAPGVAAMSAVAFFVISAAHGHVLVASVAAALIGASLGFLPHNAPPARVFLGDGGSLFVGFVLAALGLNLDLIGQGGVIRVAIPLLALAVPLFDTTLVVIARLRDGRPIFRGGTDHASHRLAARGLSHLQVALVAMGGQAACSAVAISLLAVSDGVVLAWAGVAAALTAGALLATLRLDHPRAAAEDVAVILSDQKLSADAS
jgi:UDP-GlcNAc:undecaprenyl-phosphate/decaprenyl-phosphate GlcNAc-1-phosphate transferase